MTFPNIKYRTPFLPPPPWEGPPVPSFIRERREAGEAKISWAVMKAIREGEGYVLLVYELPSPYYPTDKEATLREAVFSLTLDQLKSYYESHRRSFAHYRLTYSVIHVKASHVPIPEEWKGEVVP